jgi:hypothetical protein
VGAENMSVEEMECDDITRERGKRSA